ncbi:MAG: NAD-dependent epimerase/dehydratase family protein [Coraliomargaritaceae bacterium]
MCYHLGGTGYIGMRTWKRLCARFEHVLLADLNPPAEELPEGVEFIRCDVRQPIDLGAALTGVQPGDIDWIFNYAAVHREPGHAFAEYFDTNIPGAEHVTAFAERWQVPNIFFTSSIAVYGPTHAPTDEATTKYPSSGYGISKLTAELIHERWAASASEHRLIVCRPGVVYGAGDHGNILRMIRAVKKRIFVFPGSPVIHKSYAYIEGLLGSIEFTMARSEKVIHYNYVETPTETLQQLIEHVEALRGKKSKVFSLPLWLLLPVAQLVQCLTRGRSPIHPKRVRKAAMSTHIIPQWLIDHGFKFRYDFAKSLADWKRKAPEDFN